MNESELRTDASGLLLGSFVHDALMKEFAIKEGEAVLKWQTSVGKLVELSLHGIHIYRVKDLVPDSILSDIYAWPIASVPESAWFVPDSAWGIIFGADYLREDARVFVDKLVESKIDWIVVQVGFSIGGAMAFICRGVRLVEVGGER